MKLPGEFFFALASALPSSHRALVPKRF